MKELWEQALLPYNLPLTIALGVVVVFWLVSLLGAVGVDLLDFDLPDSDVDVDMDVDVDGDAGNIGDVAGALLRFVNAGLIPTTVVISVMVTAMWAISILTNYYLNPGHSNLLALGFALGALITGAIVTKLVTQPLVPLMKKLKEQEDAVPVIGQTGVVRSIILDSKFGQVEVIREQGAPAILNARLTEGADAIPRGTEIVVVSLDQSSGVYLVHPIPTTSI
ncbi:hypothetical protein JIN85_01660 [Luteolibacter pohnpeiensis]|uniref:DUF1449 domain-containing protein n=1 Tax=Luteolibacter pohnpeiensis TaxID=454153 RepID=A0A934S4Q7_9BACT|nr:OB-fold-containig protein [Luteolibacter pohnpeiensis]MBK1881099.1 hypothetical protein [Luteolibacter pohnpeiensis]